MKKVKTIVKTSNSDVLKHDHERCFSMTNEIFSLGANNGLSRGNKEAMTSASGLNHQNVLLYARRTKDLNDVMDALVTCIEHIIENSGKEGRAHVTGLYMEEWALELITAHTELPQ